MVNDRVTVIGAGLAGSEAAWQLATRGIPTRLFEMRPTVMTPAHRTDRFAELVCSNSLRADTLSHAAGLLKQELRLWGSLVVSSADQTAVPAGRALAVDRDRFSSLVTRRLQELPALEVVREQVTSLPRGLAIIASGPLTSPDLSDAIAAEFGDDQLSFFDAIAPIVYGDSLDWDSAFWGNRWGEPGSGDYVNCPLTEDQYRDLWSALVSADRMPLREFERDPRLFEGCLPIEEMARRGPDTIRFGPLRPVGLTDPRTGLRPYAVVQLRREDQAGTLWNLVGFQTNVRQDLQRQVFGTIPALARARYARLGAMHRNTFIRSPRILLPSLEVRGRQGILFAGQLMGVEGYLESTAMGLVAGVNAARLFQGRVPVVFDPDTAHGALAHYVTTADPERFQPMNINFGLFSGVIQAKREHRVEFIVKRAMEKARELAAFIDPPA